MRRARVRGTRRGPEFARWKGARCRSGARRHDENRNREYNRYRVDVTARPSSLTGSVGIERRCLLKRRKTAQGAVSSVPRIEVDDRVARNESTRCSGQPALAVRCNARIIAETRPGLCDAASPLTDASVSWSGRNYAHRRAARDLCAACRHTGRGGPWHGDCYVQPVLPPAYRLRMVAIDATSAHDSRGQR